MSDPAPRPSGLAGVDAAVGQRDVARDERLVLDVRSDSRWNDYSQARDDMSAATAASGAPWYLVQSNDKRRARLNLLSHLLSQIPTRVAASAGTAAGVEVFWRKCPGILSKSAPRCRNPLP